MKTFGIIFGVFVVFVGGVLVSSYISAANYGNAQTNLIAATYTNNQNVLSQYSQKVAEVAQVPGMYKDDLKEVVGATMAGRYGADGSKAVVQWIQEQGMQVDASMYRAIQQVIESGRNDFQNAQTTLIDQKRQYTTAVGTVWTGFFLKLAGYSKEDVDQYKTINNLYANDTFEKGVEVTPIKLR